MNNTIKKLIFSIMLCCCIQVAYSQQRGEEKVVFDFNSCPILTHEVMPLASTPLFNNFTREIIGVGERVKISSTKKVKSWEIISPLPCSGSFISKEDKDCVFEASIDPCDEVMIQATFEGSCEPQIKKFKVIAPKDIIFEKKCGFHTQFAYDVGLITRQVSVMPDNVSFAYLDIVEKEAFSKGTLSLVSLSGLPHGASGEWIPVTEVFSTVLSFYYGKVEKDKGSLLPPNAQDIAELGLPIATGTPSNSSLFGNLIWKIPWNYRIRSIPSEERLLQIIGQVGSIDFDKSVGENTMKMQKKVETHLIHISDPTPITINDPITNIVIGCK